MRGGYRTAGYGPGNARVRPQRRHSRADRRWHGLGPPSPDPHGLHCSGAQSSAPATPASFSLELFLPACQKLQAPEVASSPIILALPPALTNGGARQACEEVCSHMGAGTSTCGGAEGCHCPQRRPSSRGGAKPGACARRAGRRSVPSPAARAVAAHRARRDLQRDLCPLHACRCGARLALAEACLHAGARPQSIPACGTP